MGCRLYVLSRRDTVIEPRSCLFEFALNIRVDIFFTYRILKKKERILDISKENSKKGQYLIKNSKDFLTLLNLLLVPGQLVTGAL